MTCYARQYGDQMVCGRCGTQWDVNDPDPPQCKPQQPRKSARKLPEIRDRTVGRRAIATIREILASDC